MKENPWARLLAYVTGLINQELLLKNEYLKGNVLLFPSEKVGQQKPRSRVRCRERLGGLLKYYSYAA